MLEPLETGRGTGVGTEAGRGVLMPGDEGRIIGEEGAPPPPTESGLNSGNDILRIRVPFSRVTLKWRTPRARRKLVRHTRTVPRQHNTGLARFLRNSARKKTPGGFNHVNHVTRHPITQGSRRLTLVPQQRPITKRGLGDKRPRRIDQNLARARLHTNHTSAPLRKRPLILKIERTMILHSLGFKRASTMHGHPDAKRRQQRIGVVGMLQEPIKMP